MTSGFEKVARVTTSNQGSNQHRLEELGFSFSKGGAHSSRTIMLDELTELFAVVDAAAPKAYKQAILEDNRAVARMLIRESVTPVVTFRHRDQTITTPRHETSSWNAC